MLYLKNHALTVTILDPVEDCELLGTRYNRGGFIFQIDDAEAGPLLAGPTFPESYNVFDGQGIPDAFKPHLPVEFSPDGETSLVLGIGIGLIDLRRDLVEEPCEWKVNREDQGDGSLGFVTDQMSGPWRLHLERKLTLAGRSILSSTTLKNTGEVHLPFQWYPHPFFPHALSAEWCRIMPEVSLPENSGYEELESGFIGLKGFPWHDENHYQLLDHSGTSPVRILMRHPATGYVFASCSYVPGRFPLWGNERTISFEPYYERVLSPGESAGWSIVYDF